jgi:hypothetical protein
MDGPLNVDIALAGENPQTVLPILEELGAKNVSQTTERGLTGIEIVIACALVASVLANLVIRLSRLWTCGVLVEREAPGC